MLETFCRRRPLLNQGSVLLCHLIQLPHGIRDLANCEVSCDHIPRRSWALFRARDVMRGVIESFKAEQTA